MIKNHKNIFIHIGMQKSGTTTLQRAVFPFLDGVQCYSKSIPIKQFPELLLKNKNILFSDENLAGIPLKNTSKTLMDKFEENIKALSYAFPHVKIILGFREHASFFDSMYRQFLFRGTTLTPESFLDNYQEYIFGRGSFPYAHRIEKVNQYFGEGNLFVYMYEDLQHNPNTLIENLAKFLGASLSDYLDLSKVYNKGIGHWQGKILRYFNVLKDHGKLPRHLHQIIKKQLTGSLSGIRYKPASVGNHNKLLIQKQFEKDFKVVTKYAKENNKKTIK